MRPPDIKLDKIWQPLRCTGYNERFNFVSRTPEAPRAPHANPEARTSSRASQGDGHEFSQPATNFIKSENVEEFLL